MWWCLIFSDTTILFDVYDRPSCSLPLFYVEV